MKRTVAVIVALAGVLGMELPLSGCSLIGLAVDASQPADTVSVDPALGGLEGKTVLITLRNGERLAARCVKVGLLPMELYRARYLQWQKDAPSGAFPLSLGDTLHVTLRGGQTTLGIIQGFTRSAVVILRLGVASGFHRRPTQTLSIPVADIDSLWTLREVFWNKELVNRGLEEGTVPKLDALLLRRADGAAWLSLSDIAAVAEIRHSYTWFNICAFADGASLVAVVVYLVASRQ